jgi:hypothetical protein
MTGKRALPGRLRSSNPSGFDVTDADLRAI